MNVTTDYNVDVLVCGGGVAGCAAAIAAARQGMRVLLVEKRESFGGLCTNGYITGIAGHVDGLCLEWVERLAKENVAVVKPHLPAVEPEMGKVMFERMLIQAGVRFLYGVHVADVDVVDGRIDTVIAYTVNGKMCIKAKMVIDTTGDAMVASAAGAPCEVGDIEFMGMNESTSMGFRLSYVNYKRYMEAIGAYNDENRKKPAEQRMSYFVALQHQAIEDGMLPYLLSPGNLVYPVVGAENQEDMDVCLDATATYYCRNTSVEDTTRQIVDQHRKVLLFVEFLRKYVPGFERCTLAHFADQNGTRESRRIRSTRTIPPAAPRRPCAISTCLSPSSPRSAVRRRTTVTTHGTPMPRLRATRSVPTRASSARSLCALLSPKTSTTSLQQAGACRATGTASVARASSPPV